MGHGRGAGPKGLGMGRAQKAGLAGCSGSGDNKASWTPSSFWSEGWQGRQWHRMRQPRARVWDALEEGFLEEVISSGAWQEWALDGWGLRVGRPQAEFWPLCCPRQATPRG